MSETEAQAMCGLLARWCGDAPLGWYKEPSGTIVVSVDWPTGKLYFTTIPDCARFAEWLRLGMERGFLPQQTAEGGVRR